MRRNYVVSAFAFPFLAAALAQSPAGPQKTKYDAASLVTITGMVDDIQQRDPGGTCKAQNTLVIVKAEGQSYALKVGPKWFLDELTATFAKGEKLEITGWKVAKEPTAEAKDAAIAPEPTEIVVRKIKRGDWLFEPRDDSAGPNWTWMKPPKDSGKCI